MPPPPRSSSPPLEWIIARLFGTNTPFSLNYYDQAQRWEATLFAPGSRQVVARTAIAGGPDLVAEWLHLNATSSCPSYQP